MKSDNETESTSKETFTTVATVYDNSIKVSSEKEVSTSQAAQPTSAEGTSHTSGLITGNHHKLVTVAQTSETLVTIEGKNESEFKHNFKFIYANLFITNNLICFIYEITN